MEGERFLEPEATTMATNIGIIEEPVFVSSYSENIHQKQEDEIQEESCEKTPVEADSDESVTKHSSQNISQNTPLIDKGAMQSMSLQVSRDLKTQQENHKDVWLPILQDKKRLKLEEEYYKISPRELVYFDVLDQPKFFEETKKNFDELTKENNVRIDKRWDKKEIDKMFSKGLNPNSLITSFESSKWFVKESHFSKDPVILDLGIGAGWTTVMLYENMKRENPNLNVKQISVDDSPYSIAATQTMLNYKNIPYIVATNPKEFSQIQNWFENSQEGKNFSGVVLFLEKFQNVFNCLGEKSIDGVYSSHGTAYLSRNEYTTLFKNFSRTLKEDGLFVVDSLNILYTNKLDPKLVLAQMLAPKTMKKLLTKKGIEYIYGGQVQNDSKYFVGQKTQVLTGFNTSQTYYILEWCNYLLKRFDFNRLVKTMKSLLLTMDVIDEYRSDVFPSSLLKEIIEEEDLNFKALTNIPELPIFVDTQGFRLVKEK
jgi:SAM-dependent methyltransferase